jgi:predicted metal-dependent hydrolase
VIAIELPPRSRRDITILTDVNVHESNVIESLRTREEWLAEQTLRTEARYMKTIDNAIFTRGRSIPEPMHDIRMIGLVFGVVVYAAVENSRIGAERSLREVVNETVSNKVGAP